MITRRTRAFLGNSVTISAIFTRWTYAVVWLKWTKINRLLVAFKHLQLIVLANFHSWFYYWHYGNMGNVFLFFNHYIIFHYSKPAPIICGYLIWQQLSYLGKEIGKKHSLKLFSYFMSSKHQIIVVVVSL